MNCYAYDCLYTNIVNLTVYVLNSNIDNGLDYIFLNGIFELLEWTEGKLLALSMG